MADETLKKLRNDLGKLSKVPATRRLTLKELVVAAFDDIENQLRHHNYERLTSVFEEAGRPISVSSLSQYHRAERRARARAPTVPGPAKELVSSRPQPTKLRPFSAGSEKTLPGTAVPQKIRLKSKRPK